MQGPDTWSPSGGPNPPRSRWPIVLLAVAAFGGVCLCGGGILASISIPAFINYVKRSKTTEAVSNLQHLGTLTESYCREHDALPPPAGPVPSVPPSAAKVRVDFGADPGFAALGFTDSQLVYYRYRLELPGDGTAHWIAEGDLDGDGKLSHYELTCTGMPCRCDRVPSERDGLE